MSSELMFQEGEKKRQQKTFPDKTKMFLEYFKAWKSILFCNLSWSLQGNKLSKVRPSLWSKNSSVCLISKLGHQD